jgi:hypothetical protein
MCTRSVESCRGWFMSTMPLQVRRLSTWSSPPTSTVAAGGGDVACFPTGAWYSDFFFASREGFDDAFGITPLET